MGMGCIVPSESRDDYGNDILNFHDRNLLNGPYTGDCYRVVYSKTKE